MKNEERLCPEVRAAHSTAMRSAVWALTAVLGRTAVLSSLCALHPGNSRFQVTRKGRSTSVVTGLVV